MLCLWNFVQQQWNYNFLSRTMQYQWAMKFNSFKLCKSKKYSVLTQKIKQQTHLWLCQLSTLKVLGLYLAKYFDIYELSVSYQIWYLKKINNLSTILMVCKHICSLLQFYTYTTQATTPHTICFKLRKKIRHFRLILSTYQIFWLDVSIQNGVQQLLFTKRNFLYPTSKKWTETVSKVDWPKTEFTIHKGDDVST